jgi:predicted DNA-binding transcriptional regulator AlpA
MTTLQCETSGLRLLDRRDLRRILGLSISGVDRLLAGDKTFPVGFFVTPRKRRWLEADVAEWVQKRRDRARRGTSRA